jgi:nitrogen regulatory protein PII
VKLVIAVINSFKLDGVCAALEEVGVHGMTVTEAKGFGSQMRPAELYRGDALSYRSVPKIRLDIAVPEHMVEAVVEAIMAATRTGRVGDGKVWLTNLEDVVRIRDGRRGESVL